MKELAQSFEDEKQWKLIEKEILSSIKVLTLPKEIEKKDSNVFMNSSPKDTIIEDVQYFIEMDVRGHIFGTIWLLLIGYELDSNIYQHSYGNRIRKSLINELSEKPTYSPYLFEPYFQQYESWRDTALTHAQNCLDDDQDVVIITMDLKKYYYSVDITKKSFEDLFESLPKETRENKIAIKVHEIVFKIIEEYSKKFETSYNRRNILPIGFLPSNVLSNWCLNKFDLAVVNGWNPIYYGRYVDDILIVDKIEKNSSINRKAEDNELKSSDITDFFLTKCSRWSGLPGEGDKYSLFEKREQDKSDYKLNSIYTIDEKSKSEILIQDKKVKLFYFKAGESDSLLTCFRNDINKNKSEFRYMPEDASIFPTDDYSNIFSLKKRDTINKLREVEGVSINKFELSKFLGKNLRINGLIDDNIESKFEAEITKIFDSQTLIENYTSWEKVIELFVINNHFDSLLKFVLKTFESVNHIDDSKIKLSNDSISIKISLLKILHSALIRSLALNWNDEFVQKICNKIRAGYNDKDDIELSNYIRNSFDKDYMNTLRYNYYSTRMVDNYTIVFPIDFYLDQEIETSSDKLLDFNLTNFSDSISYLREKNQRLSWSEYKYYPYLVTPYDISMLITINQLIQTSKGGGDLHDLNKKIIEEQKENYSRINYGREEEKRHNELIDIKKIKESKNWRIKIGDEVKTTLICAIANVRLSDSNFNNVLKETPNRKYSRYKELAKLINESIEKKVDMLVMPEAFTPFEWIPMIARVCEKNQFAIITGIEHIKIGDKIFNLTATILPYTTKEGYKSAQVLFHLKKHYSPEEIRLIEGYRLKPVTGENYDIYYWRDCWFSVYCCYELASIKDRSLFQSYADITVAVEWNKDINNYSNILESLSRDLHCYCIQVNSSNYGDSRITQPSRTECKDIIRTKGGKNSTLLVDNLDVNALRDFQLKQFELQKDDMRKQNQFKPTPPEFEREIINLKMKKQLWKSFKDN